MNIPRRKPLYAKVGIVGVGLDVYWNQFEGLLERLKAKQDYFINMVAQNEVETVDFGVVDNATSAYATVKDIKKADVDILFVDMLTYATSSTFAIMVRELNMPIILVALQELDALDYENATIFMQLCNDDICSVPEFTGVAIRMGKNPPPVIIGTLYNDTQVVEEVATYCRIAHVLHDLRNARLGHMGHVLEAMLDMHTDPTAVTCAFGPHIVQCEPEEIMSFYATLAPENPEVVAMKKRILEFFDTPEPVADPVTTKLTEKDLTVAARAGVALEKFIEEKSLDGLAYYYEAQAGSMMREMVTNFIVGNSLLTAAGFPMCGEFDIKTCIAMLIFDRLEIGGSFAEFHPVDFSCDTVLVGHDGPHHLNIAADRPVIRSLKKYHGKPGTGAGVEFKLKTGPITMLSIGVKADGKFKFIIAEGESLDMPIPPTGNTNTHGKFAPDIRTFLKRWVGEGPTHHFALGIGKHAQELEQIATFLGIEYVNVTK